MYFYKGRDDHRRAYRRIPGELEAYRDVEHAREELAIAAIIGEVVEVDHAAVRFPRPRQEVRK